MPPGVTELIIVVVGIVAGALAKWVQEMWKSRKQARTAPEMLEVLRTGSDISNVLHRLVMATGASRVLLLHAANGGSIPQPGVPLRASVVHEAVFPGLADPVQKQFQYFPLDSHYQEMLLRMAARGYVVNDVNDLPAGSQLRDIYEVQQATWSYVRPLGLEVPGHYWYVSVVFRTGTPGKAETADFRTDVRSACAEIEAILARYHKG